MFIHPHVKFRFVMHSYPLLYTFCLYYYFSLCLFLSLARALPFSHLLACCSLSHRVSYLNLKFSPVYLLLLHFSCDYYHFFMTHTLANTLINSSFPTCQFYRDRTSFSLSLLPPLRRLLNIVTKYNIAAERKGQRERMFFSVSDH